MDWQPAAFVDLNLNADLFRTTQTAPLAGADLRQSLSSAVTKASIMLTPTKTDTLQILWLDFGRQLRADGFSSNAPFTNISFSHTLSPKLKLVVTDNDAFHTQRVRQHTATAQYASFDELKLPGRIFYVGLAYKLGAVKAG